MKAKIYYHDIGDYLSREEKLSIIKKSRSIANMQWQTLTPNEHGDWLNLRNDTFSSFISIGDKETKSFNTFFTSKYSSGVKTARDHFCWNFSESLLEMNINKIIGFYNEQCKEYHNAKKENAEINVDTFINYDSTKITWNVGFKQELERQAYFNYSKDNIYKGLYRPFCKQNIYFAKELNDRTYQMPKIFPTKEHKNLVICVSGIGVNKDFSALITDAVPDLQIQANVQCFPLYYYEEQVAPTHGTLFDMPQEKGYTRRDAISDFILERAKKQYGKNVTKKDIFYYVYGFLHSPKYSETFASDLKKMLPRLPLVEDVRDFWAFSNAGRKLASLHLNYELGITNYELRDGIIDYLQPEKVETVYGMAAESEIQYYVPRHFKLYEVEKMRFPSKEQKDTIIYNSGITIKNIPLVAYQYVVNGKSAIEWIMERYRITTHPESGIVNNPNDWALEANKPRYILDLLLNVIALSIQTVDIVQSLPEVKFEE